VSFFSNHGPSVPKAPTILHICRESREIGMEHYSLAFAGTNILPMDPGFTELFNSSGLGLKRTWVDWKRDTIFVVRGDRGFVEMRGVHGELYFLEVLASYAPDEAEKIQNLAVPGHWTTTPRQSDDRHKMLKQTLVGSLRLFTGLKKLVLYHSDVSLKNFLSITEEDDAEGSRRTVALVRRSETEVREEMVSVLEKEREKDRNWRSELPSIEVSRDWQWSWRDGSVQLKYYGSKSD
jgi:hypothetical protein